MEALALDLGSRLDGHAIAKIHIAAFSALKTFDPPLSALEGTMVDGVTRHGKFLDIEASGLHLILHLARAGWVRWRDEVPTIPPKPSTKSTLAVRVVLDDQSGLDITEAGTRKSLAMYVVRDPLDVPGIARLGPGPARRRLHHRAARRDPRSARAASSSRACSATRARSPASATPTPTRSCTPRRCRRSSRPTALTDDELATLYDAVRATLGDAVERSRGLHASELKGEKKSNLAVHGQTGQPCPVCGDTVLEVSFADSSLQYCPTCQTGGKPLADRRMSRLLK